VLDTCGQKCPYRGVDELLAVFVKTGENNKFEDEFETNGIYLVISS
jgi:hypothetical protein